MAHIDPRDLDDFPVYYGWIDPERSVDLRPGQVVLFGKHEYLEILQGPTTEPPWWEAIE